MTYHKSDVWVDDKKVKQLPREGDMVSFYIVLDDITKKEKAEQVPVYPFKLNQRIIFSFELFPLGQHSPTHGKQGFCTRRRKILQAI